MKRDIKEIINPNQKSEIAETILADLPEWFGIPESTKEYIETSKELPFIAYMQDDKPIGFVVLQETSNAAAEVYVMGVLKQYHHKGIGKQLMTHFEALAKAKGYTYLQVKTVQEGHYKAYDITNAFYKSIGFQQLECFPDLWDPANPCQIYVKYIG